MRTPATAALVVALVLLGPSWARAAPEVEPNDGIGEANEIDALDDAEGTRSSTDDVDFFVFTGLSPNEVYTATLDNPFLGIGWFASDGTLLDSVAFSGALELVDLGPDESGELILAVCGHVPPDQSVLDCTPESVGLGPYVLALPEPEMGTLAIPALATLAWLGSRVRRPRARRRAFVGVAGCAILERWVACSSSSSCCPPSSWRC